MADKANIKITVLWDDEIRAAGKLLREWHDCKDGEDKQRDLMAHAFNACLVALWGVNDDTALVMLGSRHIKRLVTDRPQLELDTTPGE